MTPTGPLLVFHAVRVRPEAADSLSVVVPSKARFLAVLEGWRLIPFDAAREGEEVLAFVCLPRSRGPGRRLIRIPELEGRWDPSGTPFSRWMYLGSQTAHEALDSAWDFDWDLRNRRSRVSKHQVVARAHQLRSKFPPIEEAGAFAA